MRCHADDVLAGLDLAGRRYLITGASGGLGAGIARALARAGAEVIGTTRGAGDGAWPLELTDPASIAALAARVLADPRPLHGLIHNAGLMACPLTRTPEGHELQLATHLIGPHRLTRAMLPALLRAAAPRVVHLSSMAHRIGAFDFEDPHFQLGPYDPWRAYAQSKTGAILHAVALNRRFGGQGLRAFAAHPGTVATDLGRHLDPDTRAALFENEEFPAVSVEEGVATALWAATAPGLSTSEAVFLSSCAEQRVATDPSAGPEAVAAHAVDPAEAERLWGWVEAL
jgi:NAD(P)-dependent dehydrogenase (short-subunit alcohol dehydrogenase family)